MKQHPGFSPQFVLSRNDPARKFQHLLATPTAPNGPSLGSSGAWFHVVSGLGSKVVTGLGFFSVSGFVVTTPGRYK